MRPHTRLALAACAVVAAVTLWATSLLVVRLQPYWVARLRGNHADLSGATLPLAWLCGTDLRGTDLEGACLRGADLRRANLLLANLNGADLRGADLRDANLDATRLRGADLRGADLRGIKTSSCGNEVIDQAAGAVYDEETRWDQPFGLRDTWGAHREGPM